MNITAAINIFVSLNCYQPMTPTNSGELSSGLHYQTLAMSCDDRNNYCGQVKTKMDLLEYQIKLEKERASAEKKENERINKCNEAYEVLSK